MTTPTQGEHAQTALEDFEVRKLAAIGAVSTSSGLVERRPIEYRRELENQFVRGYRAAESRLHAQVAALKTGNHEELAHELFAAAQLAPGEGIEDAVSRIAAALTAPTAQPAAPQGVAYAELPDDFPKTVAELEFLLDVARNCGQHMERADRLAASNGQAPASRITVEQVEDAIGLQSTAWDTIGAEKIVEAVLRLANGQAPARATNWGDTKNHWIYTALAELDGVETDDANNCLKAARGALDKALTAATAQAAPAAFQRALDIRAAQGWKLGGNKVPVLYTDSINGEQVSRDDLWLCTTTALATEAPAAGAVAGPSYGATEFGWTYAHRTLTDGDKRLMALVVNLFGNDHQAFNDLETLIDRAPTPAAQADSQPAPQGETNVQLDIDSNSSAPGQQRDVAGSVALGQPMGNGQDQAAGHSGAQGDKLLTVAERNIRSFLRSAVFKSESDREAALSCVDVLRDAARAPADSVLEDAALLEQIEAAIRDYHYELDMRKHGGLAESVALSAICNTMGMPWHQGKEAARRAARKQGGTHDNH